MNRNNLKEHRRSRSPRRRRARCASRITHPARRSRRGLTAIEYCFMLSLVFVVLVIAVQYVGSTLTDSFKHSESKMDNIGLGR